MPLRKRTTQRNDGGTAGDQRDPRVLADLCAEVHPDDGLDPRDLKRCRSQADKPDRKVHQLCKQVARALQLSLSTLPHVGILTGIFVQEVQPAPNAGRLRVILSVPHAAVRPAVVRVLEQCAGRLRSDVAAAISRKRVPELAFEIQPGCAQRLEAPDATEAGGQDE